MISSQITLNKGLFARQKKTFGGTSARKTQWPKKQKSAMNETLMTDSIIPKGIERTALALNHEPDVFTNYTQIK